MYSELDKLSEIYRRSVMQIIQDQGSTYVANDNVTVVGELPQELRILWIAVSNLQAQVARLRSMRKRGESKDTF